MLVAIYQLAHHNIAEDLKLHERNSGLARNTCENLMLGNDAK
jgi:hypothetical protein